MPPVILQQAEHSLWCLQEAEQQLQQLATHFASLQPQLAEYAIFELPRQPLALSALTEALCDKASRLKESRHPVVRVSLSPNAGCQAALLRSQSCTAN